MHASIAAKVAFSAIEFNGETRPPTVEEFAIARFVVRRLESTRGFVAAQVRAHRGA